MSLFGFIFKKIAPIPKIEKYNSFLFIAPHPDDVEIGAGGTVSRLKSLGKRVTVLVLTDGCYGTAEAEYDKAALVELRKNEARAAAKLLGVDELCFLPYHDGGAYDKIELRNDILKEVVRVKPDIIFSPDPKLETECHPDHINAGECASQVLIMATVSGMCRDIANGKKVDLKGLAYYFTARPNSYVKVKKSDVERQSAALCKYKSQFEFGENKRSDGNLLRLYLRLRALRFGLKSFKGRAEGFRIVSIQHSHCCEEKL